MHEACTNQGMGVRSAQQTTAGQKNQASINTLVQKPGPQLEQELN